MNTLEKILPGAMALLATYPGVEVVPPANELDKYEKFQVNANGETYAVSLTQIEGDDWKGCKLGKQRKPAVIRSHTDILDACLFVMASDQEVVASVSNLTTDGDAGECEALFNHESTDTYILKVR